MQENEHPQETYELSFIVKGEDTNKVKTITEKNGGKIIREKPLERVQFAYPIKKQRVGGIGTYDVIMERGGMEKINNDLRLEEDVLRFMITKKKVEKPGEKEEGEARRKRAPSPEVGTEKKVLNTDASLTNEALEKTIEEILK